MKQMRKTLSLILALVLVFSLAAVPAFAADTEAESSTSDTAYGQLHNGQLSEILSQIGIANDDNFIHGIVGVNIKDLVDHIGSDSNFTHGIVRVTVGDLFKNIASNSNYTHVIVTVVDNRININFGLAFQDAQQQNASGETARTFLTELLTDAGMTKIQSSGIVSDIAAGTLSEDQASAMVDQLAATGKISLTDITTLLGSLTDSGLLDVSTAAQLLYELMTEQAHKQYDRSGNDFSDVPAGQWYTIAVSTLANVGAITGCGDGTFQPRKSISRAEFVTILTGIYGEDTTKGMPFSDVDRSWYYDAVATAYANGWVSGYTDGTFRPNQTITRAEAVVILNSVLGRSCDLTYVQANAQAALHFTDITPGAWYYADVIEASVAHTYTKQDDGTERWTALAWPPKTANSRHIRAGSFLRPYRRPCMKPSMAVAWMSPPMTRLR